MLHLSVPNPQTLIPPPPPPPPRMASLLPPAAPLRRLPPFRRDPRVAASKRLAHFPGEPRVIRVTDPIRNVDGAILSPPDLAGPALLDSSPLAPPSPCLEERDGGEDRQRFHLNLGYAIRTLREDLPVMFYKEPCFDIYRDDIVFKDPRNTFSGVENYKRIFWALRFNGRIFFKSLWIDIISVWQPVENVIVIRWTVHGIPRVLWEGHSRFDGTSEYKLDKEGKIYEHRVDNLAINSQRKFRVLPVEELILSLGCPDTPRATFFISYLPYLLNFTWVRYYLALHVTLVWKCLADG